MTETRERPKQEQEFQSPEELGAEIKNVLDQICRDLGEHHIGGPRHPPTPAFHRRDQIDIRADRYLEISKGDTSPNSRKWWKRKRGSDLSDSDGLLKSQLKKWCDQSGDRGRVQALAVLWHVTHTLLQQTMAYHTLELVLRATQDFVAHEVEPGEVAVAEEKAMRAVCQAMEQIVTEGELFKLMNMSDPDGLSRKAADARKRAEEIADAFTPLVLTPAKDGKPEIPPEIPDFADIEAFASIPLTVSQMSDFYEAGERAAQAVVKFEAWLDLAPKMYAAVDAASGDGSAQAGPREQAVKEVNAAVAAAKEKINEIRPTLDPAIMALCAPWEQVVIEIGGITASPAPRVFVPNQAKLRYSYPFAVNLQEDLAPWRYVDQKGETKKDRKKDKRTKVPKGRQEEQDRKDAERYYNDKQERDKSSKKKRDDFLAVLESALDKINVTMGEAGELGASQFFYREDNVYGGLKVPLAGGITIHNLHLPVPGVVEGKPARNVVKNVGCAVWLELSNMGNHCLCIETPWLLEPRPHQLYRAVRAGTPFVYGEIVKVGKSAASGEDNENIPKSASWDTLHAFSRDVVVAVGATLLDLRENTDSFRRDFEPGNLQEIVIVHTDQRPKAQQSNSAFGDEPTTLPPEAQPEKISAALDNAVGGKLLLRSTHQAAAALAEWVRYPRLSQRELDSIEETPVLGTAGDWFTNTGEMTVFGFVAAPEWHTEVYSEAAQFAVSWSPLLRLWGRLLQDKIERSQLGFESGDDDPAERDSLRRIEKRVRMHLMQIKAEDLCATRALRLFLDQLLAMAQLDRTQSELEAQLTATEHLTDWYDADARQGSEKLRNVLLAGLTLLGVFGLSGFLSDLNKEAGEKILGFLPMKAHFGMWEANFLFVLFGITLFVAVYLDLLFWNWNWHPKLMRFLGGCRRKVRKFFAKVWQNIKRPFMRHGKVKTGNRPGEESAR